MPQIQLTLRNDDGTTNETTFELKGTLDNLEAIDQAVELFKNQALPLVEQTLLLKAQEEIILREKNSLISNGSDKVTILTRYGKFSFERQRFLNQEEESISFLAERVSPLLKERCLKTITKNATRSKILLFLAIDRRIFFFSLFAIFAPLRDILNWY